ncbi:MAG: LPS export ABC transporter permease LptG [Hyphomicrobiales bacterium]|nr:LPS export ABC transporter permease LptG [Hyphomicrobiales bacterium]
MTAGRTLSRYISWRFAVSILSMFALFLVLIFFVDFVELLRQSGKHGSVPAYVLVWLTLLRVPAYSELILPVAVLVGSIGAFLMLSRSSELTVVRSAGMSVWQLVLPAVAVAIAFGVFAVTAYNPMAAYARAEAERQYAAAFGKQSSILRTQNAGAWLRQDGADGQSVIHAQLTANQGLSLTGVSVIQFDKSGDFFERIEAETAELKSGRWELQKVWVSAVGREPIYHDSYIVSTYLTPTQVRDSLGSVRAVSFWELPKFIEIADRAGLPATRHKLRYQTLLSMPFLLVVMVLLAATCSLRAFRFGKIQSMVIAGLSAGFGFFVVIQISRNLGLSGLTSPGLAAWAPAALTCLLALTALLHQEDG